MSLKICHICLAYYPGMGNTDIYEYSRYLAEFGVDILAIVAGRKKEKKEEIINGVKVHRIPFESVKKKTSNSFKFALYASRLFNKLSKKENFDIVHIYASMGVFLIKLLARNNKSKWIYDIRSGAISGGVMSFIGTNLLKFESSFFDATIVLDKELKKSIFGDNNSKNIYVVPLGANFEIFYPSKNRQIRTKYGVSDTDLLVIHVGSMHPTRNLHQVIEGFKKALTTTSNLKLMFVGSGDDCYRLKKLTKDLKIENKVIFTGLIEYNLIPNYLNTADIGISYVPITPEFNVQPPLKTVEYLACGLPTIATDTIGNRRFIKNEVNGILIEDTPDAVSYSILRLAKDNALRNKLRKNSRKSIMQYDWKNIVENMLMPVYKNLLYDD